LPPGNVANDQTSQGAQVIQGDFQKNRVLRQQAARKIASGDREVFVAGPKGDQVEDAIVIPLRANKEGEAGAGQGSAVQVADAAAGGPPSGAGASTGGKVGGVPSAAAPGPPAHTPETPSAPPQRNSFRELADEVKAASGLPIKERVAKQREAVQKLLERWNKASKAEREEILSGRNDLGEEWDAVKGVSLVGADENTKAGFDNLKQLAETWKTQAAYRAKLKGLKQYSALSLSEELGDQSGAPMPLDEAYLLQQRKIEDAKKAAAGGAPKYKPIERKAGTPAAAGKGKKSAQKEDPATGHKFGEKEIAQAYSKEITELRQEVSGESDISAAYTEKFKEGGIKAPEYLLERTETATAAPGKPAQSAYEAVEVKNMDSPDIKHALEKFRWVTELSTRSKGRAAQVDRLTVAVPQKRTETTIVESKYKVVATSGEVQYLMDTSSGQLFYRQSQGDTGSYSSIEPVMVKGLPRAKGGRKTSQVEDLQSGAPDPTKHPDISANPEVKALPVYVEESDFDPQPKNPNKVG
jgi:hypothetical protein